MAAVAHRPQPHAVRDAALDDVAGLRRGPVRPRRGRQEALISRQVAGGLGGARGQSAAGRRPRAEAAGVRVEAELVAECAPELRGAGALVRLAASPACRAILAARRTDLVREGVAHGLPVGSAGLGLPVRGAAAGPHLALPAAAGPAPPPGQGLLHARLVVLGRAARGHDRRQVLRRRAHRRPAAVATARAEGHLAPELLAVERALPGLQRRGHRVSAGLVQAALGRPAVHVRHGASR
mmetsp:Transcript_23109/g.61687  ORF Transcript_23109/g.61687 Transcript_23109/m.61687 type:complete len:238 (+) Transcript_23109:187-900(+)